MIEFIDDQRQRDWWIAGILVVQVNDPELTFWRPITVRLRVSDQAGNSIFDSSALVKLSMFQPTDQAAIPHLFRESRHASGRLVPAALLCDPTASWPVAGRDPPSPTFYRLRGGPDARAVLVGMLQETDGDR
jgi:hypothetical protein